MPRFSHRLPWSAPANRLSTLVAAKQQAGVPIADLTVSNPTAVLAYPHAAIAAALAGQPDYSYHPDPLGAAGARAAIAVYYAERGHAIDPGRLALTASTSEAYALLFKLLCDEGDEILVPQPSYPLFEHLAALENVRPQPYRLGYDGSWYLDEAELRSAISQRTRAIVLVNPNNPTGSFLKTPERNLLVRLAQEFDLALISDEVFFDYEFARHATHAKTLIDEDAVLSFSLNGLSKAAAMPQMKLAWIVTNGPEPLRKQTRARLELLLDTYLSVNTPVQWALPRLMRIGVDLRAELGMRALTNYAACRRLLAGTAVHVLPVEGGWSVILQLPRTRSEEDWLLALLDEEHVLLQPGFLFDMPREAYAVASLITEPALFVGGVTRLRGLVARCA